MALRSQSPEARLRVLCAASARAESCVCERLSRAVAGAPGRQGARAGAGERRTLQPYAVAFCGAERRGLPGGARTQAGRKEEDAFVTEDGTNLFAEAPLLDSYDPDVWLGFVETSARQTDYSAHPPLPYSVFCSARHACPGA